MVERVEGGRGDTASSLSEQRASTRCATLSATRQFTARALRLQNYLEELEPAEEHVRNRAKAWGLSDL